MLRIIRKVFGTGGARDRETALREVNAALGHQRLGANLRTELDDALRTAVRRGILDNSNGTLRLLARSLEDYDRAFLKTQFLAALGRGWVEREEAIKWLTRWLGFARTGSEMMKEGKSLINGLIRTSDVEVDGKELIRKA